MTEPTTDHHRNWLVIIPITWALVVTMLSVMGYLSVLSDRRADNKRMNAALVTSCIRFNQNQSDARAGMVRGFVDVIESFGPEAAQIVESVRASATASARSSFRYRKCDTTGIARYRGDARRDPGAGCKADREGYCIDR